MPEIIFWDAWAFIALADKGYRHYTKAHEINRQLKLQKTWMITTEAVLTEVGNAFSKARLRNLAIEQIDAAHQMVAAGYGRIADVNSILWQKGYALYQSRPDKDWGHTDCISFIVMRELGIQKAFTADQHFEQAGFERLVQFT